jgi:hypothetical protein
VLKIIMKNMFDVVAGFMIICHLFCLATITYIVPVPESAMKRLDELYGCSIGLRCVAGQFPAKRRVKYRRPIPRLTRAAGSSGRTKNATVPVGDPRTLSDNWWKLLGRLRYLPGVSQLLAIFIALTKLHFVMLITSGF